MNGTHVEKHCLRGKGARKSRRDGDYITSLNEVDP